LYLRPVAAGLVLIIVEQVVESRERIAAGSLVGVEEAVLILSSA
jgi:hypothetical protein